MPTTPRRGMYVCMYVSVGGEQGVWKRPKEEKNKAGGPRRINNKGNRAGVSEERKREWNELCGVVARIVSACNQKKERTQMGNSDEQNVARMMRVMMVQQQIFGKPSRRAPSALRKVR